MGSNDPAADGGQRNDPIMDRLMACFEHPEREWADRVDALCAERPDEADRIRRTFGMFLEMDAATPAPESRLPETIGPYRVLELLGEGGMGSVYLVEQREPVRRRLALKMLKLGMDSKGILARFAAERQALALMNHDNIARVFDAGTTESGQPYFAMEYVPGTPITDHCDDRRLGIRERIALLRQVCDGVQHAHQKGVIHRDLKPGNILVVTQEGHVSAKIIDFGLARATGPRLTDATLYTLQGAVVGTPEYMSPEQAGSNSTDIDTRTDIYALGVILYELLTGELPFAREALRVCNPAQLQRILCEQDPPRPSTRLSGLTDRDAVAARRQLSPEALARQLRTDLDWIVMKALEKERARRYSTAAELAADLDRYLAGLPVQAGPPRAGYRLKKLMRRHWRLLGAGAAVFLTMLIGLVVSLAWYVEAKGVTARLQTAVLVAESGVKLEAKNPEFALRLALLALHREEGASPDAMSRLYEVMARHHGSTVVGNHEAGESVAVLDAFPAGDRLVSFTNARVLVHREGDGDPIAIRHPDGERIEACAASSDGATLATAGAAGDVFLWRLDGTPLSRLRHDPDGRAAVRALAWQTGSDRLLSGDDDGAVVVWNTEAETRRQLVTDEAAILVCAFSPDGRWAAAGTAAGHLLLWDTTDWSRQPGADYDGAVTNLVFSPATGGETAAGLLVVAGGQPHRVTRGESRSIGLPDGAEVRCAAFSPDGHWLAVGQSDSSIQLWYEGELHVNWRAHENMVNSLAFHPDCQRLASASNDGSVRIWNLRGREMLTLEGHRFKVTTVRFLDGGNRLLSASGDMTVRTWNLRPATGNPWVGHRHSLTRMAFSRDGRRVATASLDGTVREWDREGRTSRVLDHDRTWVDDVCYAAWDDTKLVTGTHDGRIRIFAADGSCEVLPYPLAARLSVVSLTTALPRRVVVFHFDGRQSVFLHEWNWRDGQWSFREHEWFRAWPANAVRFPADGEHIVVASDKGTVIAEFDGSDLRLVTPEVCTVAEQSRDGTRLVYGTTSGALRVRDLSTGRETELVGHNRNVEDCRFSPDGRFVVSTDGEDVVYWNVDGTRIARLRGHRGAVRSARFDPEGEHVFTLSTDQTARSWTTDTEALVRAATAIAGESTGLEQARIRELLQAKPR